MQGCCGGGERFYFVVTSFPNQSSVILEKEEFWIWNCPFLKEHDEKWTYSYSIALGSI